MLVGGGRTPRNASPQPISPWVGPLSPLLSKVERGTVEEGIGGRRAVRQASASPSASSSPLLSSAGASSSTSPFLGSASNGLSLPSPPPSSSPFSPKGKTEKREKKERKEKKEKKEEKKQKKEEKKEKREEKKEEKKEKREEKTTPKQERKDGKERKKERKALVNSKRERGKKKRDQSQEKDGGEREGVKRKLEVMGVEMEKEELLPAFWAVLDIASLLHLEHKKGNLVCDSDIWISFERFIHFFKN